MRLVAPGAYGLFLAVRCESRAALAMLLAFPLQRRVIHVPQKSTMTEDALHWSCYTTPPARSLEIFEEARARCPVARSSEHEGFYMLLQHADVKRAMGDHQTFSSEPQVLRPMLPRNAIPALEMDPPRHGTWRALFSGAMTAKTPREMEPFVRADINAHIDAFIERGACDIVAELAEPVPAETICRLVGIDDGLVPRVRKAAIEMFAAQGDPDEFGRKQAAFAAVTVPEIHDRRSHPREDYLTRLANIEVEDRRLDDNDFVVLLAAFLGAGHHSTTSAMASLVNEVFSRPEVRDSLRKEPGMIPLAVEETLRLRPPFFGFFRRTTAPVVIANREIAQGCDVYMSWAAANRDPQAFEEPTEFKLHRPQNRHLTFGYGIHSCPGSALARMELRVLLEELLRRTPDLTVQTDAPVYHFGGGDYSYLSTLPVAFGAGTREGPR
jgi:cytochrome P450